MNAMHVDREVATAVADLDDRHACRDRVLAAIEDILKFDIDPELKAAARRRYHDIHDERARAA